MIGNGSSIPIIMGDDRKPIKTGKKKSAAPKPNQSSSNKKGDPPLTKASSMIGGSSMQLPTQTNQHNGFVYRHSMSTDP